MNMRTCRGSYDDTCECGCQDNCDVPFIVTVNVMQESHQTTYWVCLDRGDRPKDAKPWDEGRITPFKHTNKEYADEEAKSWAKFLGVEVTT